MLRKTIFLMLLFCPLAWGQNTKPLIATDNATQTCNSTKMVFSPGALSCSGSVATVTTGGGSQWITNGSVGIGTYSNVGIGTTIISAGTGLTVMNGNVGIGTWVPTQMLTLGNGATAGSIQIGQSASLGSGGVLIGPNSYSANNSGGYSFGNTNSGGGTNALYIGGGGASSFAVLESTSGTGTSDYITFKTGSQSEKMRIDSSGNVGIGSTNPGQALDINGTVRALSAGTCTTIYQCVGGVDAGVIQTSACLLCPGGSCTKMNGCF